VVSVSDRARVKWLTFPVAESGSDFMTPDHSRLSG
jgi:hypothetical protein